MCYAAKIVYHNSLSFSMSPFQRFYNGQDYLVINRQDHLLTLPMSEMETRCINPTTEKRFCSSFFNFFFYIFNILGVVHALILKEFGLEIKLQSRWSDFSQFLGQ